MARLWVCAAGAAVLVALAALHSRFRGSPVLRSFTFQTAWRTEEILYRLDVNWPEYSEYFSGATFCVAVDPLNGLVYVAQVSKTGGVLSDTTNTKGTDKQPYCFTALSEHTSFY